jgi:histidinol-phosphate aminotransferase
MSYERDNIARLAPYAPGEQPQTGQVVKLNTNENPYPPPPEVLAAIAAVTGEQLRRYPPPMADAFCAQAAATHGVTADQIIATNGGDELLRLVVTVFCNPAGSSANASGGVGVAEPSYSLYPVLAAIHDTPIVRVPLHDDFSLPEDMARRWNAAGCRLAFLVNPHAPSGCLQPLEQLQRIAEAFPGVLVIDEAYVDFAQRDALPLVRSRAAGGMALPNVILLRSMSKGYSLAGLRFGYGIGAPALIAALNKAKDSYPTDVLAQAAATAALARRDLAQATWTKVVAERTRLTTALRARGWRVPDSQSNFILATPPSTPSAPAPAPGPCARDLYLALKAKNIFVRYFDQDRLRDKLRITIGTPEENDALLAALDQKS